MSTVKIEATWTRVGLNALLHSRDKGIREKLTHIALGDTGFTPNAEMTALTGEQERFAITDAQEGDLLLRLGVRIATENYYPVRSVAGFLDDGTMLFAYSSPDPDFLLTYLTPFVSGLDVRFLVLLNGIPPNSLTVNVTDPGSMIYTGEFARRATAHIKTNTSLIKTLHRQMQISEQLRLSGNML